MPIAARPLLLVLAAASLLDACSNEVRADRPLFTSRDSTGLLRFKTGLWVAVGEDCQVDVARRATEWPDCAAAMVFGARELEAVYDDGKLVSRAKALPYDMVVAAGDPLVLQYISSEADPGEAYRYMAVGPTKRDSKGEVTAFSIWPVVCGPLPEKGPEPVADGTPTLSVTDRPWPGLELRDSNCYARDTATVRFAAKASGALSSPELDREARWVRAGRR